MTHYHKVVFFIIICLLIYFAIILTPNPERVITTKFTDICGIRVVTSVQQSPVPTSTPTIYVTHPRFYQNVLSNGDLGLAESYMNGDWDSPNLDRVLIQIIANEEYLQSTRNYNLGDIMTYLRYKCQNAQTIGRSSSNVTAHYDIGNDLYTRMLDPNLQYSCGYFEATDNLAAAQLHKMELIARKLNLQKGFTVLDIGCGWGGLANYLSSHYNVRVLGITLSKEQVAFATQKYYHNTKVEYKILDYRHIPIDQRFDRIVSVGMLEHVGKRNFEEYFRIVHRHLKSDGIALIHSIGTYAPPAPTSRFITNYIFPGGYIPRFSELSSIIPNYFEVQDWHNFGKYYAKTLRAWYRNINNKWHEIPKYGVRFRRMWNFYLLSCVAAFEVCSLSLWQIVITKNCRMIPKRACLSISV